MKNIDKKTVGTICLISAIVVAEWKKGSFIKFAYIMKRAADEPSISFILPNRAVATERIDKRVAFERSIEVIALKIELWIDLMEEVVLVDVLNTDDGR